MFTPAPSSGRGIHTLTVQSGVGGVNTCTVQSGGIHTRTVQSGGVNTRTVQLGGVLTYTVQLEDVLSHTVQSGAAELSDSFN